MTPIFAALDDTAATMPGSTLLASAMLRTSLHSDASQMPSLFVSYLESFISAFALTTLPLSPGVLYGWKPARPLLKTVSGTKCCAIAPVVGPPHDLRTASLSTIQFIALRTWTSSNGGCVIVIGKYQTRSPE